MNVLLVILRFLIGFALRETPPLQLLMARTDGRTCGSTWGGGSADRRKDGWGWLKLRTLWIDLDGWFEDPPSAGRSRAGERRTQWLDAFRARRRRAAHRGT